jgi:hypothetical protein
MGSLPVQELAVGREKGDRLLFLSDDSLASSTKLVKKGFLVKHLFFQ